MLSPQHKYAQINASAREVTKWYSTKESDNIHTSMNIVKLYYTDLKGDHGMVQDVSNKSNYV